VPAAPNRLNFTKAALETLPPAPSGKRAYYNDSQVRGLQLMVTDRGVKTFYLYRRNAGRPLRYRIGRFPDLSVENARKKADATRGRAAMGEDLRAEDRRAAALQVTLGQAFEAYRKARSSLKPKTLYDYGRMLEVAFGDWQGRPVVKITKDLVATRHQKLTAKHGPGYADNCMRFLRAVINFAQYAYEDPEGRPLLPDNPVRRLSHTRAWNRPKRRSSYIKPDQLKPWFETVLALKADPDNTEWVAVSDWLQLTILTGLRRTEGLSLRWDDVDLVNRTLTLHDTKNHEDHVLPLTDYLLELLQERAAHRQPDPDTGQLPEYVFASYGRRGHLHDPRKPLAQVVKASGVEFIPHDLRRTFITIAEGLDIPAYALKRLLNHKMRQDVTAGYIVTDVERLRRPMQQITDFILRSVGLRSSATVTGIHKATTP